MNIKYIFLLLLCIGFKIESSLFNSSLSKKMWFKAVATNNLDKIAYYFDKVDVNCEQDDSSDHKLFGFTALTYAAAHNNEELLTILLTAPGIDVNGTTSGSTALIHAAQNGHENIVRLLLSIPGTIGTNALTAAINGGHDNIVSLLLDILEDDMKAEEAGTALCTVAQSGNEPLLRVLLRVPGVNVNTRDANNLTPLLLAVERGNQSVVKLLLGMPKIDVNLHNNKGTTPLIAAVERGHEGIVQLLLRAPKININAQNNNGDTALIRAVSKNYENLVRLLLYAHQINIAVVNHHGKTAIQIAQEKPHIYRLFVERDNMVKRLTLNCFEAIKNRDLSAVKIITSQIGIDEIVDAHGNTLVDKACESNAPQIIEYLLQNARDPRKLLEKFPFEMISPSSEIFESLVYLAYGQVKPIATEKSKIASTTKPAPAVLCAICSRPGCVQTCGGCKAVYYCSPACQKADWLKHKLVCKKATS